MHLTECEPEIWEYHGFSSPSRNTDGKHNNIQITTSLQLTKHKIFFISTCKKVYWNEILVLLLRMDFVDWRIKLKKKQIIN